MKKFVSVFSFMFFLAISMNAQVVQKTKNATKKTAKTVAHKTAEMSSHAKARVTDKQYKGKRSPNGKIVYIDDHSRYYWIDDKGHRVYIKESELRDAPMKKQ